jgi:cell division septal protein FtsQ
MVAAASLLRFTQAPRFRIEQVQVEGVEMLTSAQVQSLLGIEGGSIFLLDPAVIIRSLEAAAEIKSAQVRLTWPNQVELEVVERHTMVEWNDAGRTWWLSPDGVAYVQHDQEIELIKIHSEVSVLSVQEEAQAPVVDPAILRSVAGLSKQLPEVSSWSFDREHGLGFEDPRGWTVYFGTDGDMPLKVRVYESIAAKLESEGLAAVLISVEDHSAPYYAVR